MKKTYQTPVVTIEKYDVTDIITASVFLDNTAANGTANAVDNKYAQAVGIEW